jgi:uncharacterized protein (DUF2132 family)
MDRENVIYIHNKVFLSNNEGKWIQVEEIKLSEVSKIQKDKGRMFTLMWKIRKIEPKDKHIHKTKHDHIENSM